MLASLLHDDWCVKSFECVLLVLYATKLVKKLFRNLHSTDFIVFAGVYHMQMTHLFCLSSTNIIS